MKRIVAMSGAHPEFISAVSSLGFDVIEVKPYGGLRKNAEAFHADMQIMTLPEGDVFLLKNNDALNRRISAVTDPKRITYTETEICDFVYPDCVRLNIAIAGKIAAANTKYADSAVLARLSSLGYEIVHTNQGYARCSAAAVCADAVITSDKSIACAFRSKGVSVLEIRPGHIALCERYGGFIGGACFLADEHTLAFFGRVEDHPDYPSVRDFCRRFGVGIVSLSDVPLTDIGGAVIV